MNCNFNCKNLEVFHHTYSARTFVDCSWIMLMLNWFSHLVPNYKKFIDLITFMLFPIAYWLHFVKEILLSFNDMLIKLLSWTEVNQMLYLYISKLTVYYFSLITINKQTGCCSDFVSFCMSMNSDAFTRIILKWKKIFKNQNFFIQVLVQLVLHQTRRV